MRLGRKEIATEVVLSLEKNKETLCKDFNEHSNGVRFFI